MSSLAWVLPALLWTERILGSVFKILLLKAKSNFFELSHTQIVLGHLRFQILAQSFSKTPLKAGELQDPLFDRHCRQTSPCGTYLPSRSGAGL